jgi:predicted RNase H-like nuclease (RuvC/YqgF family)
MSGRIFGIDIIRDSVRSRTLQPHYALVRVENGIVLSEEKNVTQFQLMRCIRTEQPEIVAIDCIQEIAQGIANLHAFLSELPVGTKLVQVTGDGAKIESLSCVAARYNLSFDKLNPMGEAKMSALLASFGAGYEVLAYTGVTDIIISRKRSPGRGGWSKNRHVRKMHGAIRFHARNIEMTLVSANLKYSMMTRRAFGGESRVVFTVYVPREYVPIFHLNGGDVRIRIAGRKRNKIAFQPLKKKSKYLIIGIDPGTTVGVAALDLDGNLVYLASTRLSSAPALIREIANLGKPLIVASDKSEMPFGVEKIRRAFSAISWIPKKDILIKEKCILATNYFFKNDHERDSLSAAVYAYRTYKNKFESILKRAPVGIDVDELRAQVVRGLSLEQALSRINETVSITQTPTELNKPSEIIFDERDERIMRQEEAIQRLRTLVGMLSGESSGKDKIISTLHRKLNAEREKQHTELLVRTEIAERDRKITVVKKQLRKEKRRHKDLQLQIDRMKRYIAFQTGGKYSAFKVLPQLSRDASRKLDDEMGFGEEDLLYVLRIDGWGRSVVRELAEARVKAVILPEHVYVRAQEQHLIEVFRDVGLPVLSSANLSPRLRGKIGVVDSTSFEEAFISWVASQTEYSKEKKAASIDSMIKEYHVERIREVRELGIDSTTSISERHLGISSDSREKKVVRATIREFSEKKTEKFSVSHESVPKFLELEEEANLLREIKDPKQNVSDLLSIVFLEYRKKRKKEILGDG